MFQCSTTEPDYFYLNIIRYQLAFFSDSDTSELQTKDLSQTKLFTSQIYWSKQLKDQPVLLFSSFVQNSSINEHNNMKLRESTSHEMID